MGRPSLLLLLSVLLSSAPGTAPAEDLRLSGYEITYNRADSTYLLGVWTVADNFTNTGLAYDPMRHTLYCSHYEQSHVGECVEELRKSDGGRASEPIYVNSFTAALQGLAYDLSDSTLWLWSGDCPYEQKQAYHVTREGVLLSDSFHMPGYPGMLNYDPERDAIWSKENQDRIVRLYSCESGSCIECFDAGYTGEGIALDPFDGTFWVLTESNVFHIEKTLGSPNILGVYENPSRYYPPDTLAGYFSPGAAEGIVVDPSDRTLWFNADQHFHGGIPGGNRCWHIDPLGTYNKRILIPNGLTWQKGVGENVATCAGGLCVLPEEAFGIFISPVIDFMSHSPLADSLSYYGDGCVMVEYRGSDDAPTTEPLHNLTLPYYDANDANEGWGLTLPGAWEQRFPVARYTQVRFTLLTGTSGVADEAVAGSGRVFQSTPNPFRTETLIEFDAGSVTKTHIDIYGVAGEHIRCLPGGEARRGRHSVVWSGLDDAGRPVPSGIYFLRLTTDGGTGVLKVVVLK